MRVHVLCRRDPGLRHTAPKTVPEGDQILDVPWRAAHEDAADAGAASHHLQSGHRSNSDKQETGNRKR